MIYDTDTGKLIGEIARQIEQKIMNDMQKDASISGRAPDKQALEAKLEKERQVILLRDDEKEVKDAHLALLAVAAEWLRFKSWG